MYWFTLDSIPLAMGWPYKNGRKIEMKKDRRKEEKRKKRKERKFTEYTWNFSTTNAAIIHTMKK